MRGLRLFRPGPVLGLVLLVMFARGVPTSAQDRHKIEVMPNIPHSSGVLSVAFSPDGTQVLSGSYDTTIRLWDAATGALLRVFEGHSDNVTSVAFSPDGARVLSGSYDKTIRVWDAATGELLRIFEGHSNYVASVAFSPDGARILSGSYDKMIMLWDEATGALLRIFEGHSDTVSSLAFSPDGTRVLSGSYDTIRVWDAATGELLRSVEGHFGQVVFSPDGSRAASLGYGMIGVLDAATGALLRAFEGRFGTVWSVAFSPDGARVLSASSDNTIRLWDVATGTLLRIFEGHSATIWSVAFSPDGARVLSGSLDKTIRLWDATTGALLRTFEGASGWVWSVAFSPDGTRALSGSEDQTIRLWDAATGALLRTFEQGGYMSVAFSPDGTRVLSGGGTAIRLWDATTGALLRTFEDSGGAFPVAFSPDGARVLSAVGSTLRLWDAATGALLRTFEGHSGGIESVAFSPNGAHALSGSLDNTMKLWDATTGALLRTFEGHSAFVYSVAFSPNGVHVVSASSDSTMKLWDAATGALLSTFEEISWVPSVAYSPDGAHLLTASNGDKTIKLWDVATGALLRVFEGHSAGVRSVAFSADGRRIISGSDDTTTRFWDVNTGAQLASLIGGRDGQWLAITPAGFFAGSRTGTQMLGVVRGLRVTTIDQVHQSLFNPDLVREVLAGDPNTEVRQAAEVINLEKVVESGPAPSVVIASPAGGSQSAADLVEVTARIEDRGRGIGRIEWRVNGVTAALSGKPPGSGPVYATKQQLALDSGDNSIEVVAYNGSNLLASLPARTTIKFTSPADKTKPKLHILAIGINAYVDKGWAPLGSPPLAFAPLGLAVKDATAFGEAMKKAGAGLYGEVRVTLAVDKQAARDNLEKTVAKIAREIHPRDSFILFAAGHGTSENGRFYLIPQDYQGGPGHLVQRAIGQDRLQDWLANRIKAKRALILLDTCESGALIAGFARSRTDVPASEAAVGRLHEATGRPVLTAAAAGQFAHEGLVGASGERHGVFTWAVLDALRNGDSNGNGNIELSELVRHVQSVVPKVAAGMVRAATQEPVPGKQAARFGSRGEDFAVARRLQ